MPVVSQSKRAIYVHIPKTAGTSVTLYFHERGWIEPEDWERWYRNNDHKTAAYIREQIDVHHLYGNLRWEDFYKFSIVRNPFDMMISYWYYKQRSKGQYYHEEARRLPFPDFICFLHDQAQNESECSPSLPAERQGPTNPMLRDQAHWVLDESGRVIVDRLIKLDSLGEEWPDVCTRIGVPANPLTQINRTRGPFYPHDRYYDPDSRMIVEESFTRDFELFDFAYVANRGKARSHRPIVQFCPTLGGSCGIATYTEMLADAKGFDAVRDLDDIDKETTRILHLQFDHGIVPESMFAETVEFCRSSNLKLFVTLHRVEQISWLAFLARFMAAAGNKLIGTQKMPPGSATKPSRDNLPSGKPGRRPVIARRVADLYGKFREKVRYQARIVEESDGLIVHSADAGKELRRQGATRVEVMTHPLKRFSLPNVSLHSMDDDCLHVGYFGFLAPGKDLLRLVEACRMIPECRLHLLASIPQHAGGISEHADQFVSWVRQFDWIDWDLQFLPLDEVVRRLARNDVNVYLTDTPTGGYSTSGSIRQYLAAGRPILANPSVMVDDLKDVIAILPDKKFSTIANAIRNFDPDVSRIVRYAEEHTWEKVPDVYGDLGCAVASGDE